MENIENQFYGKMPPILEQYWLKLQEELGIASSIPKREYILIAKESIHISRLSLANLKTYVTVHGFTGKQDEINFFKHIKPRFQSHLVYWVTVFNIAIRKPIGSKKIVKKYLQAQLAELNNFFLAHSEFYLYYRSLKNDLDERYFLRANKANEEANFWDIDFEPVFSTSHDWLVTSILANEMLEAYLEKGIAELENKPTTYNKKTNGTSLKWTASKAGLVELIYALQSGGVYNNGNTEIKEIAASFQQLFQVDLGNYYNIFNEIRLRKKNRSQLLDLLKEKLVSKMDALDEK